MIHIEKKKEIFLLRGGPEFINYGDPYTFSMAITEESGSVAYIECFCRNGIDPLTRQEWMQVNDGLKFMGFKKMKYNRIKNGKKRDVIRDII